MPRPATVASGYSAVLRAQCLPLIAAVVPSIRRMRSGCVPWRPVSKRVLPWRSQKLAAEIDPNRSRGEKTRCGAAKCHRLAERAHGTSRSSGSTSLCLDVGRPDHLAPLVDFFGNELAEVGRRTYVWDATQIDQPPP
jgi:hypothetical protein